MPSRKVLDCKCPSSKDGLGIDHVSDAASICIVLLQRRFTASGLEPNIRNPVQINNQPKVSR
jgi:hypothetical protein